LFLIPKVKVHDTHSVLFVTGGLRVNKFKIWNPSCAARKETPKEGHDSAWVTAMFCSIKQLDLNTKSK